MQLSRFSFGVGDRFAQQARAQLGAFQAAATRGVQISPVWNKSHREHKIVGTAPASVREAADDAVSELGWDQPYFVDADHINLSNVEGFLAPSDFFTIDVAQYIGQAPDDDALELFVSAHPELIGEIRIPGIDKPFSTTQGSVTRIAAKYLTAVTEAGRIYRHIESCKGAGNFITEVSMDETDAPQTPPELLIILAALANTDVPVQTIAPKFTGRFNKGVDYVGDVAQFAREFSDDLAVIAHAIDAYGLPADLKLSVHSGSDKFSIYPAIRNAVADTGAGVHVKTAGTTWLAELTGLAEADTEGLALAKEVYREAYAHRQELCEPYASVIDIDFPSLPEPATVEGWSAEEYVGAVQHDQSCPQYDPNVRQLLHVGYKVAAKMGDRYLDMLRRCESSVAEHVTRNLLERHIAPLFL